MAIQVRVPALGNDADNVVVAQWLCAVGQPVRAGQPLVTVETAKTTVEIESPADGWLVKRLAGEGEEIPVHAVLAAVGAEHETADDHPPEPATGDTVDRVAAAADSPQRIVPRSEYPASPRARVLATRKGVDLARVRGSGPNGLIVVADVVRATDTFETGGTTVSADRPDGAQQMPVSAMRQLIGKRMVASLTEAAQFTLHRAAPAATLLDLQTTLRRSGLAELRRTTVNDLVLFVTSRTLPQFPELNAHFTWESITTFQHVNLGIATATERGLVVPVLPAADQLPLGQISSRTRELVDAARQNKPLPGHATAASFTVSNLGAAGIEYFTPVLDLPQVAILGVGAIQEQTGTARLPLSLTVDHRAVDGVAAARLLSALCDAFTRVIALMAL